MKQRRRRRVRNRRYRSRGRLTVLLRFLTFLVICAAIVAALILFFKIQNIVVTGNQRYTQQEIIDCTEVEFGDNMFLLNKHTITGQITKQLPYVESVRISRDLPDTLVITVEECRPAAAVVQADGTWLMSLNGKLLEKVTSAQGSAYPQVTGLELLLPTEGSWMALPEESNATEEQVLALLSELEAQGMAADTQSIDCSDDKELVMAYAGRFQVVMNYDDNFAQDLESLTFAISNLQPNETGTILLNSISSIGKAFFIPDEA